MILIQKRLISIQKKIMLLLLSFSLMGVAVSVTASDPPPKEVQSREGTLLSQEHQEAAFQKIISLLKEQNRKLSMDLRRIHREIAALRADFDKPGFEDIFAGIGYIFGLFGAAAFMASRNRDS